VKLYCPQCGSDQVVEAGEKSQIDGKMPHKCESCHLEMGPLRSQFMLWTLTVIACLMAVASGGGAVLFAVRLNDAKSASMFLLGVLTFGGFAAAGVNEMRKTRPLTTAPK
jgi:hypothetical protein